MVKAAPKVVAANAEVQTAVRRLDSLDPAALTTATAARAVRLLPPMLGANGPREYLLLVQNNAEQRATGGIPGSVALLRAVDGAVTVGAHRGARIGHVGKRTLTVRVFWAAREHSDRQRPSALHLRRPQGALSSCGKPGHGGFGHGGRPRTGFLQRHALFSRGRDLVYQAIGVMDAGRKCCRDAHRGHPPRGCQDRTDGPGAAQGGEDESRKRLHPSVWP
jgi:Protein of unknown function (DUF4012)